MASTATRHDVIIIGTGQAGVPLATRLAGEGRRVAIIERGALGGSCVNVGCTPTKTMIASARAAHDARTAGRLGVHAREVIVDYPAVVARKDAIVDRWRAGVAKRLEAAAERVRLLRGTGRFVAPDEVEVEGERLTAPVIVINTGARPATASIEGLAGVPFLDYRSALELRQLPEHLAVIGGGYIGCELGQMFRRFGSRVTIVYRGTRLLSREDRDCAGAIEEVFRGEQIALRPSAKVERVRAAGAGVVVQLAGGEAVEASHLLVAVGRRPNTDDLGCERAGLRLDENGFVIVDDHYATNVPGVYAVGDVAPGPQFTHAAWDDHRLLFDHLLGRPARRRSERLVPATVFTDPQVARVGLTEDQAKERGQRYEVASMPFGQIARAIETDQPGGTIKVLVDPDSEKILGASLTGSEAGELLHVFAVLMQAGATARAIVDAEFVHPTFAEGLQTLVMKLPRYALSPGYSGGQKSRG